MKKIVLIVLLALSTLSCNNKINPEYSIKFKLDEKVTLSGFYVNSLKSENLAYTSNASRKNKIAIFGANEKFFTKEKISGSFVMIDVYSYMEVEVNTVRTIPLLIRNDKEFNVNKEAWFACKNDKPYFQHLYY